MAETRTETAGSLKKLRIFKDLILQNEYEILLDAAEKYPIRPTQEQIIKINRGKELAAALFKREKAAASEFKTI